MRRRLNQHLNHTYVNAPYCVFISDLITIVLYAAIKNACWLYVARTILHG